MERRLFSFILASTTFFFVYLLLYKNFGPPMPQKPVAAQNDGVGDVGEVDPEDPVEGQADATSDSEPADADPKEVPVIKRPERPTWVTLGSMDPKSGYHMLVTTNSRGGGLERIELTERNEKGGFRYRRVDVRNGYLGYFAAQPDDSITGVRVNVVGPGTPAALATSSQPGTADGIQPGDVIVSVNGKPITLPEDIDSALKDTKPDQQVSVEVVRNSKVNSDVQGDEDTDVEAAAPASATIQFTATLSEHPLDLVRLAKYGGDDQIEGNLSRLSCLLTLGQVNRKSITTGAYKIKGFVDPTKMIWNSATSKDDENHESAIFDLELDAQEMKKADGQPVRITRSYKLSPGSYALDMSVQVANLGDQPQKLAYRLEGINGVTMEGWWYSNKVTPAWSRAAARDIVYKTKADGHVFLTGTNLLKNTRKKPLDPDQGIFAEGEEKETRDLSYIGVDAQYFSCSYLPPEERPSMAGYFRRASATVVAEEGLIKKYQEHAVNTSFYLDSVAETLPPKASMKHDFRLFAGPKSYEQMHAHGLQSNMYYGWFSPVAKLLVGILHILYAFIGNYGVAIIMLTIMVRGAMFPLSRKAAINAQRMQELAPELKKIADQYKDDMEGRLKAQRELQQRVGFNPMAGCLPMFLQLPIFIGLYRALSVDIELRQSALIPGWNWASNLAGPDMLNQWDSWLWATFSERGVGWLGPFFNILPVVVVALFMTQQKLFMPPPTDEQAAMTQKVMFFMTLFMGLFFFRVPAGLCLYFVASSLWGIAERILVKKTLPKDKHFDPGVIDGTATPTDKRKKSSGGGKPSIRDMIREQINPTEKPAPPPKKRKRPPVGKKNR